MTSRQSRDFIQSLEKGLAVINSFSNERSSQTLSEVAELTGLTRATARRILLTLNELGYVSRADRSFSLTPKVLDLGYSFLSSLRLVEIAQQPMERLADEVKESSSMSVLDGLDIVYVARVSTKRIMTIALALGSRLPAYPTSMGRVLLAGMPESDLDGYIAKTRFEQLTQHTIVDEGKFRAAIDQVREEGYALVDQELEEGVRSIASPIVNRDREVVAAMNISCHASRVTVATMRKQLRPRLTATAEEISTAAKTLPRV